MARLTLSVLGTPGLATAVSPGIEEQLSSLHSLTLLIPLMIFILHDPIDTTLPQFRWFFVYEVLQDVYIINATPSGCPVASTRSLRSSAQDSGMKGAEPCRLLPL